MNEGFATEYQTPEPNDPIPLYSGPITLRNGKDSVTEQGTIRLEWIPRLSLYYELSPLTRLVTLPGSDGWPDPDCEVLIPSSQNAARGSITSTSWNAEGSRLQGHLRGSLAVGDGKALKSVVAHLVNVATIHWPVSEGTPLVWEAEGWRLALYQSPQFRELKKAVGATGGYVVTHEVRLERADYQVFTDDDYEKVHKALYRFFSFIEGRRVNVILPVGQDASGNRVWRKWELWNIVPWQDVFSWTGPKCPADLALAFAGFMRLWKDDRWRACLDLAMHWHAEGNRNASGLEAGIVFVQMALERLAWEYLVRDRQTVTAGAFKKLPAADQIRRLLSVNQIPVTFPPQLAGMASQPNRHLQDLVEALTSVRNRVVHPPLAKSKQVSHEFLCNTWACGLWMLEMLLLRLFDYEGRYLDRRDRGKQSLVPWKEADQAP
jgi:hypothetical protein